MCMNKRYYAIQFMQITVVVFFCFFAKRLIITEWCSQLGVQNSFFCYCKHNLKPLSLKIQLESFISPCSTGLNKWNNRLICCLSQQQQLVRLTWIIENEVKLKLSLCTQTAVCHISLNVADHCKRSYRLKEQPPTLSSRDTCRQGHVSGLRLTEEKIHIVTF